MGRYSEVFNLIKQTPIYKYNPARILGGVVKKGADKVLGKAASTTILGAYGAGSFGYEAYTMAKASGLNMFAMLTTPVSLFTNVGIAMIGRYQGLFPSINTLTTVTSLAGASALLMSAGTDNPDLKIGLAASGVGVGMTGLLTQAARIGGRRNMGLATIIAKNTLVDPMMANVMQKSGVKQ